jgi:hypothetical protein
VLLLSIVLASAETPDVSIALLRYDGNWNPRPTGLSRLAWEVRKRTSVAMDLEIHAAHATEPGLFAYPLLFWAGDQGFSPLPDEAVLQLRQHLRMGGTLFIDVSDATERGPFHQSALRELARILPEEPLVRIPADHVFYKAFYLVDSHGGRVPTRSYLEGVFLEERLAVVLALNDIAGAMARDSFGQWQYDVGAGGDTTREMTFRLGINLVLYSLCLDYKDDQVHIPFILERRQ